MSDSNDSSSPDEAAGIGSKLPFMEDSNGSVGSIANPLRNGKESEGSDVSTSDGLEDGLSVADNISIINSTEAVAVSTNISTHSGSTIVGTRPTANTASSANAIEEEEDIEDNGVVLVSRTTTSPSRNAANGNRNNNNDEDQLLVELNAVISDTDSDSDPSTTSDDNDNDNDNDDDDDDDDNNNDDNHNDHHHSHNDHDWNTLPSPTEQLQVQTSLQSEGQTAKNQQATRDEGDIQQQQQALKRLSCKVHPNTSIPHSDASLRILRKFTSRCTTHFSPKYGGTEKSSLLTSIFLFLGDSSGGGGSAGAGSPGGNWCALAYRGLVEVLRHTDSTDAQISTQTHEQHATKEDGIRLKDTEREGNTDQIVDIPHNNSNVATATRTDQQEEDHVVIESLLGHVGDTASKARKALAAFCVLFEAWCLESQRVLSATRNSLTGDGASMEQYVDIVKRRGYDLGSGLVQISKDAQARNAGLAKLETALNRDLLSMAVDCAESLVAHGCLDGVFLVTSVVENNQNSDTDRDLYDDEAQDAISDAGEQIKEPDHDGIIPIDKEGFTSIKAVNTLSELLFLCDISSEKVELSALKYLLTTGCRTATSSSSYSPNADNNEAMLRGRNLLQAIQLCYRVYLKTYSEPNKTTARASLRQIVTSAFERLEIRSVKILGIAASSSLLSTGLLEITSASGSGLEHDTSLSEDPFATTASIATKGDGDDTGGDDGVEGGSGTPLFPSDEHRDAFLVLRSLCKLSMKTSSDHMEAGDFNGFPRVKESSLILTRSGNKQMYNTDSSADSPGGITSTGGLSSFPSSIYSSSETYTQLSPALDSKILALDLLLDILQRTDTEALLNAGPQFIYAVRNYLCHSLLKNCTSDNTAVINLSLRLFVPLIRHFRFHLKTEIEAFVTNVFFVILDSKNSTVEHKHRVVVLFEEICGDPSTLAEIFLNYDCDLSAVDLFQRIVNTLAKVAKIGLHDQGMNAPGSGMIFVAGAGATRAERMRQEHRELRLEAMRAVRQILGSLHASIEETNAAAAAAADAIAKSGNSIEEAKEESELMKQVLSESEPISFENCQPQHTMVEMIGADSAGGFTPIAEKHSLVQIYDSKKKRREDEARVTLRFNQKPSAGIKFASQIGLIDGEDPADVAQFLLSNKDIFDKTQIGEFLGREPQHNNGFALKVLHEYVNQLDFGGLAFDDAIRFFLSGFRLPGEAQKIDRIMEKFAERFTTQNADIFPVADAAFILAFSVILLNTDLHNPSIKEERRMTREGFIRNNRGICEGKDLPDEILNGIFDRIKKNPISLKEDDDARERAGEGNGGDSDLSAQSSAAVRLFSNHYQEIDKKRESDYQKERDQILRNTESLLRRKKTKRSSSSSDVGGVGGVGSPVTNRGTKFVRRQDSGLKDEYVTPMFDVTWGPALAVFSTVMESANGTMGFLLSIASDNEIELAAENASSATEVCLSGFQLAIRIAALCGNVTAGSAFVHALSNFSLLGTGRLLEHRHVRCIQTMLEIGRDDGELLGNSWEYVFKALCEVARLNRVNGAMVKADRAEAASLVRRRKRELNRAARKTEIQDGTSSEVAEGEGGPSAEDDQVSLESIDNDTVITDPLDYISDSPEDMFEEEMDKKAIDEANALTISETITEDLIDVIYLRSTYLSTQAVKDFIYQLCRVSRMEISGYGGHVGSHANDIDLTAVHYRQKHTLLTNTDKDGSNERYNQPDIYSLQKLVEVTHYNMDSRPRLVFATMWNTVSGHLTSTALHTNAAVAMYAVDSFRQLSIQFLKREELGVFEFQRRFLKPFETVMSQCRNSSVKEFLLRSVEQILLVFGSEEEETVVINIDQDKVPKKEYSGTLRSGWKPMLAVIGLASQDSDDAITELGFKMLTTQLRKSINIDKLSENAKVGKKELSVSRNNNNDDANDASIVSKPMQADRFIDLVDCLLMYVSGPRENLSVTSIDHLVTLCKYLADESCPLPQRKKRRCSVDLSDPTSTSLIINTSPSICKGTTGTNEGLELWWPILLGLSHTVGDSRTNIRIKGLVTMLAIINEHFFPPSRKDDITNEEEKVSSSGDKIDESSNIQPPQHRKDDITNEEEKVSSSGDRIDESSNIQPPQHGDLQTLLLIFRGVLAPILEFAEMNGSSGRSLLPEGFFRYMTKASTSLASGKTQDSGGRKDRIESNLIRGKTWLDTTFDHLIDGCIALALKSIEIYKDDTLVEEVLAMFNNCLISDSGFLAVRGLKRLHQFVTGDLCEDGVKSDTWTAFCHMLQQCLTVRGLPRNSEAVSISKKQEDVETINEFVREEDILGDRRYIGSNAAMVVGSLLTDQQYIRSMGTHWYLFLISGLGMGIRQWDVAASIIGKHPQQSSVGTSPPQYAENALYARKWMVRLLVKLMSTKGVLSESNSAQATDDVDSMIVEKKYSVQAKQLLQDECKSFFAAFLEKEAIVSNGTAGPVKGLEIDYMTKMVCTLLDGICNLEDSNLAAMSSLTPSLTACIQINDRSVRTLVHKVLQRIFQGSR